ncbi:MAG: hypothetical protein DWH91_17705 [Planctomycetota bacterium]|nr:MAG: hypothetical protein DWH91_17705 [Planctomycetota bacterium]
MNWRILAGWGAVAVITLGLWWNRTPGPDSPRLVIRRIVPTEAVLRGSPNEPVQVELELTNMTGQLLELAPLRMDCSCQISKSPDNRIAAGGTTRVALSLRYPPARSSLTPVEFKAPTGELLARMDIPLEVDRQVPYFVDCPERVEIPIIEGLSDPTWSTSAATVELANQPPYVQGIHLNSGGESVRVSLTNSERSYPGVVECQRAYQIQFEWQHALKSFPAAPVRGVAVLELSDGTQRPISWIITRKAPLAMMYDSQAGSIRGVRRSGARGMVTLHCVPEGSGTLIPDRFDSGQPIVAKLETGRSKLQAVEARYQGTTAVVPVLLPIP